MQILEAYAGAPKRDWVALLAGVRSAAAKAAKAGDAESVPPAAAPGSVHLDPYVGTFEDPWRGAVTISRQGDVLDLKFSHTDHLQGPMTPLADNLFIVRWNERSLNADAYVRFTQDFSGKVVGFTMKAVSSTTDFSFDFPDLNFTRVADAVAPTGH
jgi:hypothetical protein